MALNDAFCWNSKYWQVCWMPSSALCGQSREGILIGNLHCEPRHWQLPDRFMPNVLGEHVPHLTSAFALANNCSKDNVNAWTRSHFEQLWHQLWSWTPLWFEIDCLTWTFLKSQLQPLHSGKILCATTSVMGIQVLWCIGLDCYNQDSTAYSIIRNTFIRRLFSVCCTFSCILWFYHLKQVIETLPE